MVLLMRQYKNATHPDVHVFPFALDFTLKSNWYHLLFLADIPDLQAFLIDCISIQCFSFVTITHIKYVVRWWKR